MNQPQPTAALSDARNVFSDEPGPDSPRNIMIRAAEQYGWDDGLGGAGFVVDAQLIALEQEGYRLARAESAPGVTIPISLAWQIVVSCAMAGGDAARSGRPSVTLDEIVERMMDLMREAGVDVDGPTAALADAGGERRIWIGPEHSDGGDGGWVTLVSISADGATCVLRDDNGAEWHTSTPPNAKEDR